MTRFAAVGLANIRQTGPTTHSRFLLLSNVPVTVRPLSQSAAVVGVSLQRFNNVQPASFFPALQNTRALPDSAFRLLFAIVGGFDS